MQGLRASDRSSLKPLAVAALALAAVAAPTVPAVARVTGWSEPAPASARCTEGSPAQHGGSSPCQDEGPPG